jgi:uncharacterized protein (TIGR02271 family)
MGAGDRDGARPGQVVRAAGGERVGTVVSVNNEQVVVGRGLLSRRRLVLPSDAVAAVRGDELLLCHTREELERLGARGALHCETGCEEEVRVPLVQEEVTPFVHVRRKGRVRVHKVVRTERRHLVVEVRREELVVEHLPVDDETPPRGASGPFDGESHVFTLWQEEVEVVKRPVVYEEVRVSKMAHGETWSQRVPLRFEVAHVEEEGEVAPPGPAAPPRH